MLYQWELQLSDDTQVQAAPPPRLLISSS
jgi:hypothetical protein